MSSSRLNGLLTLVLLSLAVLQLARAQSDIYQYEEKRQNTARYCGKKLSNMLQLVCHGLYNTMFKKSVQAETEMDDYPYAYEDSYPLRSRASANAMMGRLGETRFRRDSRGVHDECCVKACSFNEMINYCALSKAH